METGRRNAGSPPGGHQLRSLKLGEQVAQVLVRRLTRGRTASDAPPTEQEICEEFGFSKTVAREVISQLVSIGLVTVRHGRRMVRREPGEWNYFDPVLIDVLAETDSILQILREVHQVRLLLEPEVAGLAAAEASAERIARMGELVRSMHAIPDDPDAYLALDVAFHGELVAAVENRILTQLVESIGELLRASRRVSNLLPQALIHATAGHEAVLRAVESRDAAGAREAMRTHLQFASAAWTTDPVVVQRAV